MRELLYALKESKKELCNGQRFSIDQNVPRQDMPLPLFNGYYKQSTPPKALTHSEGLENSHNKNKEFVQNGCCLFHLEYNPVEDPRIETVWSHFIESRKSELVLGRRSKIFVLPNPGQQAPTTITLTCHYMHFHICYTGVSCIHSHATMMDLDKWVEVSMVNPETLPPRKFTTLRHEYMDLRTPDGLEVFHAVIPCVETAACGSSIDCLYLKNNHMAKDLSSKIQVCPSAWWWHLFKLRGYTERMVHSLLNCFEYEASQLAYQSTFDERTWVITTQFANSDDFLERVEADLGFDGNESLDRSIGDGAKSQKTAIKISTDAKASLASTLNNLDMDLAVNSHASVKSRHTNFHRQQEIPPIAP